MKFPYQPSALLFQDEIEVAECVVIDGDTRTEKAATERPGRRSRQERVDQRKRNNGKKAASGPAGEKELQELIRLCEYEVNQDLYRGIGFLENNGINNNNNNNNKNGSGNSDENDEAITNAVDADSNETDTTPSGGEKKVGKIVTPWDVCQWGILSVPKDTGPDDRNTENNSLDSDNPENLVRNLTESCCPSILAWTKDHLEEQSRKKQQSHKTRKQRNNVGNKRNRSSLEQNDEPDPNKFPRLGLRPSDSKYRCPCDANPFCLGSMGGIVNDLLKERSQHGITISIIDEGDNDENDDSSIKKRAKVSGSGRNDFDIDSKRKKTEEEGIEIVDVDENMKPVAEETESESSSIFAFMGGKETSLTSTNKKTNKTGKRENESKIDSQTTTVAITATCKRLGPRWTKPEMGEPAQVFSSSKGNSGQPFDEEGYSATTKEQVDKLRGFEDVEVAKVRKFIQNIFELSQQSDTVGMTMDEYIQTMIEWHKSLIFVNPTIEERDVTKTDITIALPPGIQNLGATCYLNTQLQCLAQIPVFLDGIFSWRPVNPTHKMNEVMTKLQKLLAQMLLGGDGKYTSLDFSNALGIQHNEQQDPNEFARLLFDRMEESFQQCSSSAVTSQDNVTTEGDLGKLLHRIFHGTTTYETICMKCGKTSVRSEGFMDLNLPIVHREDNEDDSDESDKFDSNQEDQKGDPAFVKRKRRKKGMIEKAFERQKRKNSADTDVQYCLDQYTKTEKLEGDNQYFCDACNSKQDAQRVMSLTELPPVLNIQLSRYVFDREKFVKKKLTDKVRLPTILTVDQQRSGAGGNEASSSQGALKRKRKSKKKYILCAVMKHRGTSAYSGHYIAEAMDWTIGQWYEFNDEIVKVLPTPSNSYIPYNYLGSDEKNNANEGRSAGSEDAYNMYYVDEKYLAENAINAMSRNKRLTSIQDGFNESQREEPDVLNNLIREKVGRYSVLTEMCYADYAISERLRRRKDGIRKHFFMDPSSLLFQESQAKDDVGPYFWVDGNTLRQFLACDRSLDDKLTSGETIVCPNSLLCSHGHLHPKTARHGKLLRKSLYDSYSALLSGERKYMSSTTEAKESDVIGNVISSGGIMTCQHCSKSYGDELSKKLEFLKNLYDLYVVLLDETKDSLKNAKKDSADEVLREQCAYIVSRSTITKFKKLVHDLMKSVTGFSRGGSFDDCSGAFDTKIKLVLDGIDDLDISSFPGSPTYRSCTTQKTAECTVVNDQIDFKFNSKITCSHGNCNDFSLRIVRFVPYEVWAKIKKIFPDAIEHKIILYTVDGTVRKPNVEDNGCVHCRTEKDAINNLTNDIERWAKETKSNFALKKLLDGKTISVEGIAFHNFDNAQNNCRLVHRDDITNLCTTVRLLSRVSKSRISELSFLKTYVETIAFPSYHSVVLDFEKQPNTRLQQSIRSLTCCEHKRVIKSAIIDSSKTEEELQQRCQLSNNIAVLSDEEYSSFINALSELLVILNCDSHREGVGNDRHENSAASMLFEDVHNFSASCHPVITMSKAENKSSDEVLLFSLDGNSKEFSIVPGFCDHDMCKKDFVPSSARKNAKVVVDSVSVDSTDARDGKKAIKRKQDYITGSIVTSPIVVESDLEDYKHPSTDNREKIRVFQYKVDSELDDALQSLKSILGSPNSVNETGHDFGLRRSTRKRKAKYPVGCITSEHSIDIGLHHNVAALRLLLFQNCQIPLDCNLSIALSLGDDSVPEGHGIAFDESTKTLKEVLGFDDDLAESSPSERLFLLYQQQEAGQGKKHKSGDIEATLMDSLLQASNIDSPDSKKKKNTAEGRKQRNRSSERGFQGSLLHSSSSAPRLVDEQKKPSTKNDDSCCQQIDVAREDNTQQLQQEQAKPKAFISDDEIEEIQTIKNTAPVSDSSDEEVAIVPSLPSRRVAAKATEIDDDKQMELVCMLIELTESNDQSRCFETISRVIKSNPNYNEGQVLDAAVNEFFDGGDS